MIPGQLHTAPEGHGQKRYLKYTRGQMKPIAINPIPTITSAKTVNRRIRHKSIVSDSSAIYNLHEPRLNTENESR